MKHICYRCECLINYGTVNQVTIGSKKFTLCDECTNDVLNVIYKKPELLFGDETVNVK